MIDAAFVGAIAELTRRGDGIQVLKLSAEPAHVYLLRHPDGKVTREEAIPRPVFHKPGSLKSLVQLAVLRYADTSKVPEIWYSRSGVTVVFDPEERRDVAFMKLAKSPQFEQLENHGGKPMAQAPFLRWLKVDLHGAVPDPFIDGISIVKFRYNEQNEGTIKQGSKSVGRKIESELEGAETLVDGVSLSGQGFVGGPFYAGVNAASEIEVVAKTMQLTPFPGQLERALRRGEADVGREIESLLAAHVGQTEETYNGPIRVYYGTP